MKHGSQCSYAERIVFTSTSNPANSTSASEITAATTKNVAPSTRSETSESAEPPIGLEEMELLHHFSTSTCYTITRLPVNQTVWQIKVPQIAFSFPFLLRSVLALSALHLAFLNPERHDYYVAQANLHHDIALRTVSAVMCNLNDHNAPAVYLFSTITALISCAQPRLPDDLWISGEKDIEWLSLLRGIRSIIDAGGDNLKYGILEPMLKNGWRRGRAWAARPPGNWAHLDHLRYLLEERVSDKTVCQHYLNAVDDMKKSFATVAEIGHRNCETADVFIWLMRVSDDYLHLLRQRKPEAMVIFSYFCVITYELEWAWWMQGLSIHLMRGIYFALDDEYRGWLKWPMKQLNWTP